MPHWGQVLITGALTCIKLYLKVVHLASFSHPRPYEREYEGIQCYEPISREHEGLVDVLQVGGDESAGYFFYVMELADNGAAIDGGAETPDGLHGDGALHAVTVASGNDKDPRGSQDVPYTPRTLAHEIKKSGRLPVSRVIDLGIRLAEALEFLHSRGLVHRDIKPSNIIFAGDQPKFADVGLVTDRGEARTFVGTEGYIPPEGPGSSQADIFSLGKVLYEAATGRDRLDFPELPTLLGDQVEDTALLEFNEILLKACEAEPGKRYRTAQAMLNDLQAIQSGISLRGRNGRRRRLRALGAIAGVLLVVAGGVGVLKSRNRPYFDDHFDGKTSSWWEVSHTNWGPEGLGTRSNTHRIADIRRIRRGVW